jgi:hypothetical protein
MLSLPVARRAEHGVEQMLAVGRRQSRKVAELQGTYGIPRGTACLASWLKGSLRLALFHPPRVAKPRHDDLSATHVVLVEARVQAILEHAAVGARRSPVL